MTSEPTTAEQSQPLDVDEELRRLGKSLILEIPQMVRFHRWLDGKRLGRRSCVVIGESRTGKTYSCDSYHLKCKVTQIPGQPPIVPVLYWHCPTNLSVSSLFIGLLQLLQYQAIQGRIRDLRERVKRVLHSCQVEMIILDEAQRITDAAMAEIRDISDLGISVVLVGTDRLNTVISNDEQVENRFFLTYRFSKLSHEELREITALWEEHVLKLPETL